TLVFTCLSQDVIAHVITHALLAGMNLQSEADESRPDVLAFLEAFADLVPLLLHFWPSDVLRAQIAEVQGQLDRRSLLGAVAFQFGEASGRRRDGLRNALGSTDASGNWQPRRPDPNLYRTRTEPHDRGDILVAAVFLAFRRLY